MVRFVLFLLLINVSAGIWGQEANKYREAAERDDKEAQYMLGLFYGNGEGGVIKDDVQALSWYRKAAEQGHIKAQHYMGLYYENGRGGLTKDYKQALFWFQKAAEQGYAYSQLTLGNYYSVGAGGVAKDLAQAESWYRKAAEQGQADAQKALAELQKNKTSSNQSTPTTQTSVQDASIIKLFTTSEGKTQDEAVTIALRDAVEQTLLTFVMSDTRLVSDEGIMKEIVSASSGIIPRYVVFNSAILSNGTTIASVKADISVAKLITFVKEKGFTVEQGTGIFAEKVQTINLQKVQEDNELVVLKNLERIVDNLISDCFNYSINTTDPVQTANGEYWKISHVVDIQTNQNFEKIKDLLESTILRISMDKTERASYQSLKKNVYPFSFVKQDREPNPLAFIKLNDPNPWENYDSLKEYVYYLRNPKSIQTIALIINNIMLKKHNFIVNNGLKEVTVTTSFEEKGFMAVRQNIEGGWRIAFPSYIFNNNTKLLIGVRSLFNKYQTNENNNRVISWSSDDLHHFFSSGHNAPNVDIRRIDSDYSQKSQKDYCVFFCLNQWIRSRFEYDALYSLSDIGKIQKYSVAPTLSGTSSVKINNNRMVDNTK